MPLQSEITANVVKRCENIVIQLNIFKKYYNNACFCILTIYIPVL